MERVIESMELKEFLFNKENGFLINYHFKKGIDLKQLDELYEILERLKFDWQFKNEIPKSLLFFLITIISALRKDLTLYSDDEIKYCLYEELIDNLDNAISICLSSDIESEHFNRPLKDLGY